MNKKDHVMRYGAERQQLIVRLTDHSSLLRLHIYLDEHMQQDVRLSLKLPVNLYNLYARLAGCASGKEGTNRQRQHDRADENVRTIYMSDPIGSQVAN